MLDNFVGSNKQILLQFISSINLVFFAFMCVFYKNVLSSSQEISHAFVNRSFFSVVLRQRKKEKSIFGFSTVFFLQICTPQWMSHVQTNVFQFAHDLMTFSIATLRKDWLYVFMTESCKIIKLKMDYCCWGFGGRKCHLRLEGICLRLNVWNVKYV